MAKSLDITMGKPLKLFLQFAIPLIIGNLFQQAYTLADRVIVGQFVGADAYSAVGATTALTNLFMSVCMGMSIGAGDSIYSMMNGGIEIVTRIAFVFILTSIPSIGMWGIFITTGLTLLITALFALWRYKKGDWMNKSLV